jgi:hypothetical protein
MLHQEIRVDPQLVPSEGLVWIQDVVFVQHDQQLTCLYFILQLALEYFSVLLQFEPLFCVEEAGVLEDGELGVRPDVEVLEEVLRLFEIDED